MDDPRRPFAKVKARYATLNDPAARINEVQPMGSQATSGQLDAMRETMEILANPENLTRVRMGRQAVGIDDVVPLGELPGGPAPAEAKWQVIITGPLARELGEAAEPAVAAVRQVLDALAVAPTEQGRELGMGLVGVWSARGESHRVLYALHQTRRLVTVLSVEALA